MTSSAKSPNLSLRVSQSEALLEHSKLAIITLDLDGVISEWNQAAEKIYGYSAADICGSSYARLLPESKLSEFQNALGKIRRRRELPHRLTAGKRADGSEFEVDIAMHGLFSADDELFAIMVVCEDVSQHQALQQQLRRHGDHIQAIVQTVIDGIVTIDVMGIITAANPSTERMFGYRGHELIGQNVKILMPEPYKREHDGYLHNYATTGQRKVIGIGREVVGLRKDGSVFPLDLAVSELGVGDEVGYVGVMRDITERKEAALAVKRLNDELQANVTELATTLEHLTEAQAQLVESGKMASLGGLVAGIAHEINTPVGICVTASTFLSGETKNVRQQFSDDSLDAEGLERFLDLSEEATDILERNLSRAADLIGSFKQVAVDRSSDLQRTFKLKEFINESLASLKLQLRNAQVTIDVDCAEGIELHSKPGALSQILINLIQNSLIHAFPDSQPGQIKIVAELHGEMLRLCLSDNGCGVPEENLKQIFDPFFTTRRGKGGTGLGLSVVYNLVRQALQGEIRVSRILPHGTEFELQLPIRVHNG